jgi:hypothetical protein
VCASKRKKTLLKKMAYRDRSGNIKFETQIQDKAMRLDKEGNIIDKKFIAALSVIVLELCSPP